MKMKTSHLHNKSKQQKLLCKISPKKEEKMKMVIRNQKKKQDKKMAKKMAIIYIMRKFHQIEKIRINRAFWKTLYLEAHHVHI